MEGWGCCARVGLHYGSIGTVSHSDVGRVPVCSWPQEASACVGVVVTGIHSGKNAAGCWGKLRGEMPPCFTSTQMWSSSAVAKTWPRGLAGKVVEAWGLSSNP